MKNSTQTNQLALAITTAITFASLTGCTTHQSKVTTKQQTVTKEQSSKPPEISHDSAEQLLVKAETDLNKNDEVLYKPNAQMIQQEITSLSSNSINKLGQKIAPSHRAETRSLAGAL